MRYLLDQVVDWRIQGLFIETVIEIHILDNIESGFFKHDMKETPEAGRNERDDIPTDCGR